jgi:hypothetical protein
MQQKRFAFPKTRQSNKSDQRARYWITVAPDTG